MFKIVIGSDRFKHLTQFKLSEFLDHAYSLGINKIDTAPMYESEKMIGRYLQSNPNFLVSTKTKFIYKEHQSLKINENFKISLDNLKTQSIECLFLHNTPPSMISKIDIEEIFSLKKLGLIRKIGYSGHNFKIKDLKLEPQLDCLMVSFNALDVSDEHLIQQSKKEIYIKRPMANFVFKPSLIKDIKFGIKSVLKSKKPIDTQSYKFRFDKIQSSKKSFNENLEFYLKFITLFHPEANYVFGVSSIKHLNQIVNTLKSLNLELNEEIINYYNRVKQLGLEYKWKSLP
jgi:aryl-alcohol dehydrogenase-like predicted oxidoreductase